MSMEYPMVQLHTETNIPSLWNLIYEISYQGRLDMMRYIIVDIFSSYFLFCFYMMISRIIIKMQ